MAFMSLQESLQLKQKMGGQAGLPAPWEPAVAMGVASCWGPEHLSLGLDGLGGSRAGGRQPGSREQELARVLLASSFLL